MDSPGGAITDDEIREIRHELQRIRVLYVTLMAKLQTITGDTTDDSAVLARLDAWDGIVAEMEAQWRDRHD